MDTFFDYLKNIFKASFVVGTVTAMVIYFFARLSSKSKTGIWGYDTASLLITALGGGFCSYLVGTFLSDNPVILGFTVSRDFILGFVGGIAYPTYTWVENNGSTFINKILDKITDKFISK